MKPIVLPQSYNYIGSFITFRCNYRCSYCINHFIDKRLSAKQSRGQDWVLGLNRIIPRDDLPITLQGGEPTCHPDFFYIINNLKPELKIDILTNIRFDAEDFIHKLKPERLKRKAPYASIRVSFHPEVMDLAETIKKVSMLQDAGFSVGIWTVLHPKYEKKIPDIRQRCLESGIDFRTKDFLGYWKSKLYGSYRYQDAFSGTRKRQVLCRATELLIAPDLNIYRCHSGLYANRNPIGNLLNPCFQIEGSFRECGYYGYCNPCDIKVKTNRFQIYGHTSVEIKSLR